METGRILKIDGHRALVLGGQLAACFGCMSAECGDKRKEFWAINKTGKALAPGQWVTIANTRALVFLQAFLYVLLPMLSGILVPVFLWSAGLGLGADLLALIGIAIFFALSASLFLFLRRFYERFAPRITASLED